MKILSLTQGHTDNLGDQAIAETVYNYYTALGHDVIKGQFYPSEPRTIAMAKEEHPTEPSITNDGRLKAFAKRLPFMRKAASFYRNTKRSHEMRSKVLPEYAANLSDDIDLVLVGGGS